jgi:hypothetical protein
MMKRILIAGFVLAAAAPAAPARADVLLGASWLTAQIEEGPVDLDGSGYKVFGGFRWFKFLGAEGQYLRLGDLEDSALEAELTSAEAYVVGILPLGLFELFGKVGYAWWDVEFSGGGASGEGDGTDVAWGVGGAVRIGEHVGIRGEWEVIEVEDLDELSFASLGVHIKL